MFNLQLGLLAKVTCNFFLTSVCVQAVGDRRAETKQFHHHLRTQRYNVEKRPWSQRRERVILDEVSPENVELDLRTCIRSLEVADADSNRLINEAEYATFITAQSSGSSTLTSELQEIFYARSADHGTVDLNAGINVVFSLCSDVNEAIFTALAPTIGPTSAPAPSPTTSMSTFSTASLEDYFRDANDVSTLLACHNNMESADSDGNKILTLEEYLMFLETESSSRIQVSSVTDLPAPFLSIFLSEACTTCFEATGDESCCVGDRAHISLQLSTDLVAYAGTISYVCRGVADQLALSGLIAIEDGETTSP